MPKTLYRSRTNRILAGVCGGLGEYFEIDPWIVRIFFILLHGAGLVIYIILAIAVPEAPGAKGRVKGETEEVHHEVVQRTSTDHNTLWAVILIGAGLIFLAQNLSLIPARWDLIWPLLLVIFGVYLLTRATR